MKTVLYLDVLLLVNFLVDYCLVCTAGKITGGYPGFGRCAAGALVGAVSSLVILLPELPFAAQLSYQCVTCALITLAAFGKSGRTAFLMRMLWLLLMSMLLAGAVLLCILYGQGRGLAVNNLTVYLYVPPGGLVAAAALVYALTSLWLAVYGRRSPGEKTALRIELGDASLCVQAMLDTGFQLRDPFFGSPVVLADYRAAAPELPEGLRAFLDEWFCTGAWRDGAQGVRLLPCRTAAGDALLPGVAARIGGQPVFLAFSGTPLEIAGVQALYGQELAFLEQNQGQRRNGRC